MNGLNRIAARILPGAVAACVVGIAGCAGPGSLMQSPSVELSTVEVVRMDFDSQTFELGFSVHNPNPFPLPVRGVSYRIRLNDQGFASGESRGNMTVPAGKEAQFVVSVDLDLMRSGTQLTSLLKSGLRDNLVYALYGELELDLPTNPSLEFTSTGTIAVQTAAR